MGRPWKIEVGDRFWVTWDDDDQELVFRFLIVASLDVRGTPYWLGVKDEVKRAELACPVLFDRYGVALAIAGETWRINRRCQATLPGFVRFVT